MTLTTATTTLTTTTRKAGVRIGPVPPARMGSGEDDRKEEEEDKVEEEDQVEEEDKDNDEDKIEDSDKVEVEEGAAKAAPAAAPSATAVMDEAWDEVVVVPVQPATPAPADRRDDADSDSVPKADRPGPHRASPERDDEEEDEEEEEEEAGEEEDEGVTKEEGILELIYPPLALRTTAQKRIQILLLEFRIKEL